MPRFRCVINSCVFLSIIFRLSSLRPGGKYAENHNKPCTHISIVIILFTLQMVTKGTNNFQHQGEGTATQVLTNHIIEESDGLVNDSVIRYIYNTINHLCPYSDFCNITGSELRGRGIKSCCDSCGCDEECGERMDCCFDFMDNKKIVQTNNLSCSSALADVGGLIKDAPYYYMVDKCPRNETYECKSEQMYSWGSLFPLYANSTGLIYYNSECARCNDITDGKPWELYVDCLTEYITKYIYDFLQPFTWKHCVIRFIPPANAGVDKLICYRDQIGKCNATAKWNTYEHFISEACNSVNAPAFLVMRTRDGIWTKTYRNVFCELCSGEIHSPLDTCPLPNWELKTPVGQQIFTILMDGNIIKDGYKESGVSYRAKYKQRCLAFEAKHAKKKECRPVLCPYGSTRTKQGCRVYAVYWFHRGYKIHVEMHPKSKDLPMLNSFHNLSKKRKRNVALWFDSRGIPLEHFELYTESINVSNVLYVNKLNVFLGRVEENLNATDTLRMIGNSMSQSWKLVLNGKQYFYDVRFDRHNNFVPDGVKKRAFMSGDRYIWEKTAPTKIYDFIRNLGQDKFIEFTINKMFYCEQVELSNIEWVGLAEEIQLNITGDGTEKILGDAEYGFSVDKEGNRRARICVDDFSPHYYTSRGGGRRVQGVSMIIVIITITLA